MFNAKYAVNYSRPSETFCSCGSILKGMTEEVKKEAGQRINSRIIMYVFVLQNIALKNCILQGVDDMENLQNHKKLKKGRRLTELREEAQ